MKHFSLLLTFLLVTPFFSFAQHFGLYNTQTMYDAFENPSQTVFKTDSSRRFSFNFFIPNGGSTASVKGPGMYSLKRWMYSASFRTDSLSPFDTKGTRAYIQQNTYLLAFKIYHSVRYHREMGFSWQLRTDGFVETGNPSLIVLHNYDQLANASNGDLPGNPFKNRASLQSYHQFSFTWRENYSRQLSYGIKLSYLSGIAYAKGDIRNSYFNDASLYNPAATLDLDMRTTFRDSLDKKMLYPGFKNPGFALSLGTSYRLNNGWNISAALKDLGMIYWAKESYILSAKQYEISEQTIRDDVWDNQLKHDLRKARFTASLNARIELMANKDLGFYQPTALVSKSLLYPGVDAVLVNRLNYRNLNISLSGAYNANQLFQFGTQLMIKSPNAEFFIGSDDLFKTANTIKTLRSTNISNFSGNGGASVYLGFALKFGRIMSRWQNDNYVPGISLTPTRDRKNIIEKILGSRDGRSKDMRRSVDK